MKLLTSLAGGFAGALSVTLLHELIRKIDRSAPRLELLGKEATVKLMEKGGLKPPAGNRLYATSMTGSLLSNALYYSFAGARMKNLLATGGLLGLMAGFGAITLPQQVGLPTAYTSGSAKRKWMTVGLYVTGGLVAAAVTRWLDRRNRKPIQQEQEWERETERATESETESASKPVLDITV